MAPAIASASRATRAEVANAYVPSPRNTSRESSAVASRVAETASRRRASWSPRAPSSAKESPLSASDPELVSESRLADRLTLAPRATMSPSPQSARMCGSSRLGAAGEPKTVDAGKPAATSPAAARPAAPSLIAAAAPLGVPLVNMRRLSTETPPATAAAPAAPAAAWSSSMRSLTSSASAPSPANAPMRARITATSSKRASFFRLLRQMPSLSRSQKIPPTKDMK